MLNDWVRSVAKWELTDFIQMRALPESLCTDILST